MASSGDLTDSGLLYEGNFITWKAHIVATLRVFELEKYLHCDSRVKYAKGFTAYNGFKAAALIRANVSPYLLLRVPHWTQGSARELMEHLEALAQKFRFMDLPAELRVRVYEFSLRSDVHINLHDLRDRISPHSTYAPIARVSKQVRQEILPIFYSSTTFHLDVIAPLFWEDLGTLERNIELGSELKYWASKLSKTGMKHLRRVVLKMRTARADSQGEVTVTSFTFSPNEGLRGHFPEQFDLATTKLLDDHIENVESTRKILGLQGEAIIMALVSNPQLWEYGKLQCRARA